MNNTIAQVADYAIGRATEVAAAALAAGATREEAAQAGMDYFSKATDYFAANLAATLAA